MSDNESMLPPAGPEAEESPLRKITRRYIIQSYYAKERRDTQNNTEHSGHRKIMDADRHCNGYYRRVLVSEDNSGMIDNITRKEETKKLSN